MTATGGVSATGRRGNSGASAIRRQESATQARATACTERGHRLTPCAGGKENIKPHLNRPVESPVTTDTAGGTPQTPVDLWAAGAAQGLLIEHAQPTVLDADRPSLLPTRQRPVDALARQANQVRQLLLRDAQHLPHAGKQHRVKQIGHTACHAHVRVGDAVDFASGDELT